jgi:uncharacterized protein
MDDKNRIKRLPDRGHYDEDTIYGIIDETILCHIGFIQDGQPFVIPALHARRKGELLIHGASTSRLMKHVQTGNEVSVSIAILDGIVLAKSVFHQSVNYRSVVLFGKGQLIEDKDEKLQALEHLVERITPGAWGAARKPNATELKATSVISISIESASAKIRTGPPKDDAEDLASPVWAGVLPVKQIIQTPIRADYTDSSIPVPDYVLNYISKVNK